MLVYLFTPARYTLFSERKCREIERLNTFRLTFLVFHTLLMSTRSFLAWLSQWCRRRSTLPRNFAQVGRSLSPVFSGGGKSHTRLCSEVKKTNADVIQMHEQCWCVPHMPPAHIFPPFLSTSGQSTPERYIPPPFQRDNFLVLYCTKIHLPRID